MDYLRLGWVGLCWQIVGKLLAFGRFDGEIGRASPGDGLIGRPLRHPDG